MTHPDTARNWADPMQRLRRITQYVADAASRGDFDLAIQALPAITVAAAQVKAALGDEKARREGLEAK